VGCISRQSEESGFPPAQNRLTFVPTLEEIVAFTVPHLENAENPVMSFGQGCEGEPLLVADTIAEAVREVRKRTDRGVININTNGGDPGAVEKLCEAGMESIRVSMNSAQPDLYHAYYRPIDYSFDEVLESVGIAKNYGLWVSLNYFVFPGLTDHEDEMEALSRILAEGNVDMIQTRNLNLDPFVYIRSLGIENLSADFIGVRNWALWLRGEHPSVRLGYFNPPRQIIEERK
jgi:MoaA/NifB/PqqE/SkfB family radical SAM enzyme